MIIKMTTAQRLDAVTEQNHQCHAEKDDEFYRVTDGGGIGQGVNGVFEKIKRL